MTKKINGSEHISPTFTIHATRRMSDRVIHPSVVSIVMQYGHCHHVRGADIYALRRRDLDYCSNEVVDSERLEGVQVVCLPGSDTVLTVYRNGDLRSLKKRTPKRRSYPRSH